MSGFAAAIAFAVVGFVALAAFGYFYVSLADTSVMAAKSVGSVGVRAARLESAIAVNSSSIRLDDPLNLYFEVQNQGFLCVRAKEFRLMDVIVVYYEPSEYKNAAWLAYDPSLSPSSWRIESVTSSGRGSEAINPVRGLPNPESGCWDPGEIAFIHAVLPAPADTSRPVAVAVSTPWGSYSVGSG